jgi:serine/threonine-protein kinase HipA
MLSIEFTRSANQPRHRFTDPTSTLPRLAFNILVGNTDDHALTPAYDICPQGRTGNEATQALLIAVLAADIRQV